MPLRRVKDLSTFHNCTLLTGPYLNHPNVIIRVIDSYVDKGASDLLAVV